TVRKSRKVEQKRKRTPAEKAAKTLAEMKKITTAPASFKPPFRVRKNGQPDRRYRGTKVANDVDV
ncbi:MAG TPA: hypothetical protein VKA31_10255, partial [Mariprofundaceae bacterium]|nr:hypothetical protein [Mariprofundaceae bacterium]